MSTSNGGTKLTIPGEIRVKIPGFPWGTIVLVLEEHPNYPDREFLVTPKWESIKPSALTINKVGGSVQQGLLRSLDLIMRQPQMPAELFLATYRQSVRLTIQSLEEEPIAVDCSADFGATRKIEASLLKVIFVSPGGETSNAWRTSFLSSSHNSPSSCTFIFT